MIHVITPGIKNSVPRGERALQDGGGHKLMRRMIGDELRRALAPEPAAGPAYYL